MKTIFKNNFDIKLDEGLNPETWAGATGFCFDDQGKVAIVYENEKGYWGLPGGGKEGLETPEQTFIREVKEEAQADAIDVKYFHCVYGNTYDENNIEVPGPENKISFRYICKLKNISEFIPNKDGFEIDERRFVTLSELPEYITWMKDTENGKESLELLKKKLETI